MYEDYRPAGYSTWTQRVLARLGDDRPALIETTSDGAEEWTGAEFRRMVSGAVDLLDREGVTEGTMVPALLATRPASVALLLAGALSGRPLAPLAPRLTEAELVTVVADLPGEVLVAEPGSVTVARAVAAATGKRVVLLDGPLHGTRELTPRDDPDGVALVMHTSGTTGRPKRVLVRDFAMGRRADVVGYLLDLHPGDRLVTTSLFHHMGALGNIGVALGNGAALVTFPAFSVDAWRELGSAGPTHAVTIPSVFEMLLAAGALESRTMRVLGYGASPIHPDTMKQIQESMPGVAFVNLFGQTEGSPVSALLPEDHRAAAAGRKELLRSVGRAAPGTELRIDEPDADGVGEVWARCPHSFSVDAEGWQHTGDLGRIAEDGYVYLVGRRGDKIIRGGENVYPLEVEQVLTAHPGVRHAVVVPVPDRRLGETIGAYLVPADPANPPGFEELRAFARVRLAGFKVPVLWRMVDDLPRNPSGKVLRRTLIARAEAAFTT
ncbi:class I adenylate-forming enzyme family protein [Cryptosporangium sp. NPDC051539]|uniref:class I adenylate-forming enzyme family protein n=1 Tax=Cryptosporangium sp. NPDC051539 TaxID=3363962 RepID=UPI00379961E3